MKQYILLIFLLAIAHQSCVFDSFTSFEEVPSEIPPPWIGPLIFSYDEFTDGIAIDESVNGFDGVIHSFTVQSQGSNEFLQAEGTGEILVDGFDFSLLDSFTFSIWLKSFSGTEELLLSQDDSTFPAGAQIVDSILLFLEDNRIELTDFTGNELQEIHTKLLNGQWNMLTVTSSLGEVNSTYKVYANGEFIGEQEVSSPVIVPNAILSIAENFTGSIDKIRLYDSVLGRGEILTLFDEQTSSFSTISSGVAVESGLMHYFDFEEGGDVDRISATNLTLPASDNFSFVEDTPLGSGVSLLLNSDLEDGLSFQNKFFDKIGALSACFWIKLDPDFNLELNQRAIIFQIGSVSSSSIYIGENGIDLGVTAGFFPFTISNLEEFNSGEWHHIALTVKQVNVSGSGASFNQEKNIYIDGVLFENHNPPTPLRFNVNSPVFIGGTSAGNTISASGNLDNVRFYNRALTMDEIQIIIAEERQ